MTTLHKTLPVAAIRKGTVIDHITAGQALKIIRLLRLAGHHKQVTVGLNLPSQSLGIKDIIKVEDRELTPNEANQVAILAPKATINIIQNFEVINKFNVQLPAEIRGVVSCPNPRCITNHEPMQTFFLVVARANTINLQCRFCRKTFSQADTQEDTPLPLYQPALL